MNIDPKIMLLDEMVLFVKVVETGSFSEAARQLGISPSVASRGVARLEKGLSVQLLQRTTRKLRLNECGEEAYKRCRSVVNAARLVHDMSAKYAQDPEGLVRISAPKSLGRFVIHPLIPEFLRLYPKVDVQLLLSDGNCDLIDSNLDLVVHITDQPPPGLVGRCLLPIDQVVCASPAFLEENGRPEHPLDIEGKCCICENEMPQDGRWKFKQGSKIVKVNVAGRYCINHSEGRLDAILHHVGIGCLPSFTARAELDRGRIIQILPNWSFTSGATQGSAWLLYQPTHYLPPKVRVLVDYLVEQVRGNRRPLSRHIDSALDRC